MLTISAIVLSTGVLSGAQAITPPYIEFGGARVALGMTQELVEASLGKTGLHLTAIPDANSNPNVTIYVVSPVGDKFSSEGQVTFVNRKAAFVSYHFPTPRNAVELAQEIAGAISSLDNRVCVVSNFNGQGTGGSNSQSIFDCGPKRLLVMVSEPLGGQRSSSVQLEIGSPK